MIGDPRWILEVLDDLLAYAQENCRPEVAWHLEGARRHLRPYLSDQPPPEQPDPQAQAAVDLLDDLIAFAGHRGREEARLHLLAARKRLAEHEQAETAHGKVVTFPLAQKGKSRQRGS